MRLSQGASGSGACPATITVVMGEVVFQDCNNEEAGPRSFSPNALKAGVLLNLWRFWSLWLSGQPPLEHWHSSRRPRVATGNNLPLLDLVLAKSGGAAFLRKTIMIYYRNKYLMSSLSMDGSRCAARVEIKAVKRSLGADVEAVADRKSVV